MENVNNTGKLYLNMILKEDEPIAMVQRSLDSVKDYVDGMYITLTYTNVKPETSPLLDLLKKYEAKVSFFQWIDDFASARQYAMDQVPHGSDQYIYWQDADDILHGDTLYQVFQNALHYQWASVFLTYWYRVSLDDRGDVKEILIEQKRERIVRNDGTFKWMGMLHETLIDQRADNVQKVPAKDPIVIHLTDDKRVDESLPRNIRILEKQAENENHKDPRTLVYLAKGYFDIGIASVDERETYHTKSLELFNEYLEGSGKIGDSSYREASGWSQERANAWQFVSEIYKFKGELGNALIAISNAIDEAPEFPIYYIDKAMVYTHLQDYNKAKQWLKLATSLDMPDTTIITTPRDMKMKALEVDSRIALHENDMARVRENLGMMLESIPESEDLKERYKAAIGVESANKAAQCVVYLGKYLERTNETEKIPALLNAVPNELQTEKFYAEMRHRFIPPRIWENNEIAILCGPGFEQWSPNSIDKGLGGSEEAVVYLSEELHKLGWSVTVYANPQYEKGVYNGVTYLPYYDINIQDVFNVLVLWRGIGFADMKPKAKYTMLWMHDMPNNPDFTEERLDQIDSLAVLSEYHKEQFRMQKSDGTMVKIPDHKFFVTRNGIPDFNKPGFEWQGDPHKIIYSSSPDRGLVYLLLNWGKIREQVPDATLDVYYGFDVFDAIYRDNPGRQKWKARMLKMMDQEGISYKGRVSHFLLHKAFTKSGIWAYPTDFTEISCITAMKAQALGAVPVVTNFAALKETVRNGLKVDVNIQTQDGQEQYIKALVEILKSKKEQKNFRKEMTGWAKQYFTWEKVAKEWSDKLNGAKPGIQTVKSPLLTPEQFSKVTEGLIKEK